MPKATTEKFSRAHQLAPKKKESHASGSNTNPLFNTARFGQHILKNPSTAQKSVSNFFRGKKKNFIAYKFLFGVRIVDAVSSDSFSFIRDKIDLI